MHDKGSNTRRQQPKPDEIKLLSAKNDKRWDTYKVNYIRGATPPDAIPETYTAPESRRQPPLAGGGVSVPPATSVHPEVSDALLVALQDVAIVDEHCALMGAVIEKIQSTKSGLNEACISLIRGFEVCFMSCRRVS